MLYPLLCIVVIILHYIENDNYKSIIYQLQNIYMIRRTNHV